MIDRFRRTGASSSTTRTRAFGPDIVHLRTGTQVWCESPASHLGDADADQYSTHPIALFVMGEPEGFTRVPFGHLHRTGCRIRWRFPRQNRAAEEIAARGTSTLVPRWFRSAPRPLNEIAVHPATSGLGGRRNGALGRRRGPVPGGRVDPPFLWLPPLQSTRCRLNRNCHSHCVDADRVGLPGEPSTVPAFLSKSCLLRKRPPQLIVRTARGEVVQHEVYGQAAALAVQYCSQSRA